MTNWFNEQKKITENSAYVSQVLCDKIKKSCFFVQVLCDTGIIFEDTTQTKIATRI